MVESFLSNRVYFEMSNNVVVLGTQWGDEGKRQDRRLADRTR